MDSSQKNAYLRAMLTEPGDIETYRNNAYFKQAIDSLIEMIPAFIDGLLKHSELAQKKIDAVVKALRETNTLTYRERPDWDYPGLGGTGYPDDR